MEPQESLAFLASATPMQLRAAPFRRHILKEGADAEQRTWLTRNVLAADWAIYEEGCDRLEEERARHVCHAYPQGFQLYTSAIDGHDLPVGYTAWLPIREDVFLRMRDAPHSFTHRGQITAEMPQDSRYFYLFSVGLVAPLRKSVQSRQVMQDLAAALNNLQPRGIAAVTVADDGIKAVTRLGMTTNGDMTHDGDVEPVYTACIS